MIVGRDDELGALAELLAAARAGCSRTLVLRGEAGVGKSTLLRAAVDQAAGMTVLSCAGVESEIELAFSGLHQLLTTALDGLDALPVAQADAVRRALGRSDGPAAELLVSAGVLGLLAANAEHRPHLIVADDVQWLDRATTRALLFTCRRLLAEPIAVLLAVRDPDTWTVDTGDLPELHLAGLDRTPAAILLESCGWSGPQPLRNALIDLTAGNPLALHELAMDHDAERLGDAVALAGTVPLSDRLHAAFSQGVSGLSAEARTMLLLAACDDTGNRGIVQSAAKRLGVPPAALDEVERAKLVEDVAQHLRFRHPLIRSAVYRDAATGSRIAAHRALGDELSSAGDADRAAWHHALAASGADDALAAALERTAEASGRRGGGVATVAALELAARLSTTTDGRARRFAAAAFAAAHAGQMPQAERLIERAMAERPDEATTIGLARLRGMIVLDGGDPTVAHEHLDVAASTLATGAADAHAEAASILLLLSDAARHADRLDLSIAAGQRIAELDGGAYRLLGTWLAAAADGALPVEGTEPWQVAKTIAGMFGPHDPRGAVFPLVIGWLGPHHRQARALGIQASEALRAAGMAGPMAPLLSMLVDLDYQLGMWPAALAHAEEGLRFAADTGQRTRLADLLAARALLAAGQGDHAACQRDTDEAMTLALKQHNRLAAATATWAAGSLALTTGDVATGYGRLLELTTPAGPCAQQQVLRKAMPDLVEAAVRSGQQERAATMLAPFIGWAERSTLPWAQAHLHRCRALVSTDDSAEEHFHLATSAGADLPYEQARTALLHGEWLRRDRRPAAARTPLMLAVQLFDGLGAVALADRARSELRAAGGSARRSQPIAGSGLTPQELQVAQLAAAGMSNREIAQQLFLSPRTVGYHLYKLFPKLGIAHRAQLRELDLN